MTADYAIFLGTPEDIPGVLTLQEANLPHNGGSLSVRFSADWFQRAIDEKSLVVGRREGEIIGFVLGTSFGLKDPAVIIQSMLRAFPAPADLPLWTHLRGGSRARERARERDVQKVKGASFWAPSHAFRAGRQSFLTPSPSKNGYARAWYLCQ